nr:hypothetical protein Iba_chr02bCG6550 [Ipomoea batatas]GMC63996.1 hypothetical protein Iba_chr02dCG0700 [Ipomoea batatas]GMC67873.1 hypothetical protein Iba_chr02fCG6550 [Ipomoea batatas]
MARNSCSIEQKPWFCNIDKATRKMEIPNLLIRKRVYHCTADFQEVVRSY